MISVMILLVVATDVFASAVVGMLNDGQRLPPSHLLWDRCGRALCFVAGDLSDQWSAVALERRRLGWPQLVPHLSADTFRQSAACGVS
jgi:hypothetical protein